MNEPIKAPVNHFLNGALWMIAMRWMMRLIGLVSTVILARLLTPTDFGIVALALIVVGLLEILSLTSVDLALIQRQETTREHYDTAWTIQIIQGIIVAILLIFLAPHAAVYFDEPALVSVIYFLALKIFIFGFQNIAVVDFRKNLHFSREFKFHLYKKVFSFIFVVSLAFTLRDYWALIYGLLAAVIVDVIISYRMHSFRPRISFSRMGEIWSFSQWVLLSKLGYFLNQKTDQFVIGGASDTEVMGVYHLSTEIATMPTAEVAKPLRRAFFPSFAKIAHMSDEYSKSILKAIGTISILIFALGVGISAISEDFVMLMLGDKWLEAIPLIQVLAIFGVVAALSSSMELLLLVSGRGKLSTIESWIHLAVLVPVVWFAAHNYGVYEVALGRTLVASMFVFVMIYLLTIATPVKYFSVIGVIWRPLLASAAMFFVVKWCHQGDLDNIVLRLAMDIIIGAVTYISSLVFLWVISGRASGIEQDIYAKAWVVLKRTR